ncbi:universal stress protein [Streptomyces spirodelae]|uniref:Universal stress protein n=1 Tax=Streptomyces spirodelae TaxID=2812904 RepID=A0ABS3WTU5_9ACTN|nr:universal stress protein [Streptomyces spirodelae]MBO8186459.1 universal stress protein [Streptomyces spirodelae]
MTRSITVGLDGSPQSRAAAEWAAREAELRGLAVRLVQVREPVPEPMAQLPLRGTETHQRWTERIGREAAEGLRLRHPGVRVTVERLSGRRPAEALVRAARDDELLVLGSRGLSGVGGFLAGSVGLAVVASAERPVVLVRAGEQNTDGREEPADVRAAAASRRPVLLGLDIGGPDPDLIEFAFEEAARRKAPLRVLYGCNLPAFYGYAMAPVAEVSGMMAQSNTDALNEALRPWRQKYPDVETTAESRFGSPSFLMVEAAREASLVVVGRRIRRASVGTRIGSVTHALLHHATVPVAVVAHD